MPTQIDLIQEAYNRGILPDDKKPLYEEAVRRGLIQSGPSFLDTVGQDMANSQPQDWQSRANAEIQRRGLQPAVESDAGTMHAIYDAYRTQYGTPAEQAQPSYGQRLAAQQQQTQRAENSGHGQLASAAIEALHPAGQVMAGLENVLAPAVGLVSPGAAANMKAGAQELQDVRGNTDSVGGTVGGLVGNLPVFLNPILAGGVAAGETYHGIEEQKAAGANVSPGAETLDIVGQGVLNAAMSKLFAGNVTGGATAAIREKLAQYVPDLVAKYGARGAVGALINGAQGVASNTLTKETVDPNVGVTDGLGKNLLLGAGMEMGMGALHDFAGRNTGGEDVAQNRDVASGVEGRQAEVPGVAGRDEAAATVVPRGATEGGNADPLAGATFDAPTGTDPATEQRLNAPAEEAAAPAVDRPKDDLSFTDPHQAREIATARAGALEKPMYIYPGEGGKYVVDSRQPDFQAVRVTPDGKFEMADPTEAKPAVERRAAYVKPAPTTAPPTKTFTADQILGYIKLKSESVDEGGARQLLGNTDYQLRNVAVGDLTTRGSTEFKQKAIEEYAAKPGKTSPPVVADATGQIIDGNRRLEAAKLRGDKTIMAYVPVDEPTAAPAAKGFDPASATVAESHAYKMGKGGVALEAEHLAEMTPKSRRAYEAGVAERKAPTDALKAKLDAAFAEGDAREASASTIPVGGGEPDATATPKPPEEVKAETATVQKTVEPIVQKTTPLAGTRYKSSLIARTADNLFTPIMNRVRDISPRIFDRMMRTMEFEPGMARENEAKALTPVVKRMSEQLGGPGSAEYKKFWVNVRNGDFDAARKMVNPEDFAHVTEMLDRLHAYQEVSGQKLGKIANYWPDFVTDYKGLDAAYGDNKGLFEDAWDLEAKRIGRPLNDQEKLEVANSVQQGYGPRKPGSVGPAHARTRTVGRVDEAALQYRLDPFAALYRYLDSASRAAGRSRFLGKSTDVGTLADSIGEVIQKEVDAGHLDKGKQEELKALLTSRLLGDSLYMHPLIKKTKDLTHLLTLGQFRNTVNQVLDFAVTASEHGIGNATKGLREAIKISHAERKIVLEDAGMHEYGEEYRDVSGVGRVASKALDLTGFKRLDRIGKETRMNAAYNAFESAAKRPGSDAFKRLEKEYRPVLGDQFDSTMADLREGRKTENVRYMAMIDLTKVQPVTLSNMPKTYLDNPNGRILYTLKTFQIQQLDWLRRDIGRKLNAPGSRREGLSRLSSLLALTTMLGVGKEIVGDLIKGRDVDPARLGTQAVDSMLGLVGMSTFQLGKFADKPVAAAIGMIEPSLRYADDVWGDLKNAGDGKGLASVRYLPVIGDPLYYWAPFGKGSMTEAKNAQKEFKGRLNALHTDAYRAYQSGDTDTAEEAIHSYNNQRPQGTKALSLGDLRYLPPSSPEKKAAADTRRQAIQAYKGGDVNAARDLLAQSNKGSRSPGTISIIKKRAAEGSQNGTK